MTSHGLTFVTFLPGTTSVLKLTTKKHPRAHSQSHAEDISNKLPLHHTSLCFILASCTPAKRSRKCSTWSLKMFSLSDTDKTFTEAMLKETSHDLTFLLWAWD